MLLLIAPPPRTHLSLSLPLSLLAPPPPPPSLARRSPRRRSTRGTKLHSACEPPSGGAEPARARTIHLQTRPPPTPLCLSAAPDRAPHREAQPRQPAHRLNTSARVQAASTDARSLSPHAHPPNAPRSPPRFASPLTSPPRQTSSLPHSHRLRARPPARPPALFLRASRGASSDAHPFIPTLTPSQPSCPPSPPPSSSRGTTALHTRALLGRALGPPPSSAVRPPSTPLPSPAAGHRPS